MKKKGYGTVLMSILLVGAVVGWMTFNADTESHPAVEYRAVCRNLPANAHWNGSGEKDDGTRKEIPQIESSPNVRTPSPVGIFSEVGSDAECHFVCDGGYERYGNNCLGNTEWKFDDTGSSQTFIAPYDGEYTIELRGAGGDGGTQAGKGGYTKGTLTLLKGETLYLYIGNTIFNGGGKGYYTGGGATDVRLLSGAWNNDASLNTRIMVAGGGGGIGSWKGDVTTGGYAGGLTGNFGEQYKEIINGNAGGGTQLAGGKRGGAKTPYGNAGGFGVGGIGPDHSTPGPGGGGGGYYGGGGGGNGSRWGAGGGGSSFISGYTGAIAILSASDTSTPRIPRQASDGTTPCTEALALTDVVCSYHYSDKIFSNAIVLAGNTEMPSPDGNGTMIGNAGEGYAKITFVSS